MSKTLSVLTACFNEEGNVREVYERVRAAIAAAGDYKYEHVFIDNASTDNTVAELKAIAASDKNVKIILAILGRRITRFSKPVGMPSSVLWLTYRILPS